MPWIFAGWRAGIQPTTAATDALLMGAAFACCLWLRGRKERYVSTGMLLIGIAAFIGSVRFAVNPDLAELHGFVTDLAMCTGLPLIAVQFVATCMAWPGRDGRMTVMGLSVVGFAAFGLAFPFPLYSYGVGALSMLLVGVGAARCLWSGTTRSSAALAGAVGFGVASALTGVSLDGAHLVLAASCVLLTYGLPERASDWDG